jgi:hypothetical protein
MKKPKKPEITLYEFATKVKSPEWFWWVMLAFLVLL